MFVHLFLVKFVCLKILHMFIDISCFFLIKKTQNYLWKPSILEAVHIYERIAVLDHLLRAFLVEYSISPYAIKVAATPKQCATQTYPTFQLVL